MAKIKAENTMVEVAQPQLDLERPTTGVSEILAYKDQRTGKSPISAIIESFSPKMDPDQELKSVVDTMNERISAGVKLLKEGKIDPVQFNDRINELKITSIAQSNIDPKHWGKIESLVDSRMKPLTDTYMVKQEGQQWIMDSFGNVVRQHEPGMDGPERFYDAIVSGFPQYGKALVAELSEMSDPAERDRQARFLVNSLSDMAARKYKYDRNKLAHDDAELGRIYTQREAKEDIMVGTANMLQTSMRSVIFDKSGKSTLTKSNWSTKYNLFRQVATEWALSNQELAAEAGLEFGTLEAKIASRVEEMEPLFEAMSGATMMDAAYHEAETGIKLRVANLKNELTDQDLLNAEEPRLLEALAFGEIYKEMISNDAADALGLARVAVRKSDRLEELINDRDYQAILGEVEDGLAAAADGRRVNLYSLQQYYNEITSNTELLGEISAEDDARIRTAKELYRKLLNSRPKFRTAMTIRKQQLKDITDSYLSGE